MKYAIMDVSNLIHRSRHSIRQYDTFEECVSMILQLLFNSLNKAYTNFGADHCVLCMDDFSWRRMVYPDYKLSRRVKKETCSPSERAENARIQEMENDLLVFFGEHTNTTVLKAYGVEADDFIARWTQLHDTEYDSHIIISSDSDFRQLVSENVDQFDPLSATLYTMDGVYQQSDNRRSRRETPMIRHGSPWLTKKDKDGNPISFDPQWELFFKCIRGDSADYIKSSYPRVREKRLREVFANRGSLEWNNFFGETWGDPLEPNVVRDKYQFNKMLIDLTEQPDDIKEIMDETIEDAISAPSTKFATIAFVKFCRKHRLPNLARDASRFGQLLSRSYWDTTKKAR